jgi:hypothetical protein
VSPSGARWPAHGWTTTTSSIPELAAAHGVSLPTDADRETEAVTELHYVTATRT